ncbi:3-oxoacyl-[acyl-carrier protein] reductase [Paenibacillus algorifonticola]|uniref:3-oxoacyl-[acyl-carrier protein] reductase n=1 Tax=Paenibacillus algorifonticola TaxID=684063 RepID=A0A1I2GVK9_9BACL|nr:SDR family NAD(P)-dependent oxidoreductase [Paenibacillus algorifonticola]SFF21089.1 3-oxoacyl-[acyl-carrier protein] reductase [Paenibacillus algorifonticola]
MDFKDQVVLVTGSTQHTGLALATAFLTAGATVIVNGEEEGMVDQVIRELKKEYGERVAGVKADLAQPQEVEQLFKLINDKWGKLNVLVNNACMQAVGFHFLESSYSEWKQVIDVNLNGLFAVSQQAARMMKAQGGGAIVNIGSNAAAHALRSRSPYVASKGGVDALTRAMALDLAEFGIRANSVVPGYVRTSRWDDISASEAERRRSNIPLGIEVMYEDVIHAVLFLASHLAKNITGTSLVVDGGMAAQLVPSHCEAAMPKLKELAE